MHDIVSVTYYIFIYNVNNIKYIIPHIFSNKNRVHGKSDNAVHSLSLSLSLCVCVCMYVCMYVCYY